MTDTGTIEVGKNADLLILDADPLADITNTRRISQVIMRGSAVRPIAVAELKRFYVRLQPDLRHATARANARAVFILSLNGVGWAKARMP